MPTLVHEMGDAFPELKAQQQLISKVMKEEEDAFLRTLEKGISMLDKAMEEMKGAGQTELDGVQAFRLFDTYGFPLDLTELICRENGFTVNEGEFNVEMQKQKERARNAAAVENSDWVVVSPKLGDDRGLNEGTSGAGSDPLPPNLGGSEQQFVGYDFTEYECHILRYRKVTQKKNEFYELVLDNTPFYGEMGGQVGDCGVICNEAETIEIIDTSAYREAVAEGSRCPVYGLCGYRQTRCLCRQSYRYPPARLCLEAGARRPCGAEGFFCVT